MKKFDLTFSESYEAYLNHGDSERVRLREEQKAMTTPDYQSVVDEIESLNNG